jgi:tetratricopeptide (TPR) repeat protein
MVTARDVHHGWELARWIAAAVLMVFVILGLASRMGGAAEAADEGQPAGYQPAPQPLPPRHETRQPVCVDLAARVWALLDLQQRGEAEQALAGWRVTRLPPDTDHWRFIALAQAHLTLAQLDDAQRALDAARHLEPGHAVIHYFQGLVCLAQSEVAAEWNDGLSPLRLRLARHAPARVVPNTRDMYRYAALRELELGLQRVGAIRLDELLVAPGPSRVPLPTAAHLLLAIRADQLQPIAHELLGQLHLEHGWCDSAERHLDQAAANGVPVAGYRHLGDAYEARGRHLDAARAYGKAIREGEGRALPTQRLLQSLHQELIGS